MKTKMKHILVLALFVLPFLGQIYGQQRITNLTLSFSNACVSSSFNDFNVEFGWDGNLAAADNQFIVELSSPTGEFSGTVNGVTYPVELATFQGRGRDGKDNKGQTLANPNITRINFSFPTSVGGTGYKIRVRATKPNVQAESNKVAIHYVAVQSRLRIEEGPSIDLCKGQKKTLSADHKNAASYIWYKDGNVIPNEKKATLEVSETGKYQVEVDNSSCSSAVTKSTEVEVKVIDETGLPAISVEGGNVKMCEGATQTLSASIKHSSGYKYIWYKDGVKVKEGEGAVTYEVLASEVPANFSVEYSKMGTMCDFAQRSAEVSLSKHEKEEFELKLLNKATEETYSGGSVPLRIDISPRTVQTTIKWYKDGLILNDNENNPITTKEIQATEAGTYKVEVASTADCPDLVVTKTAEVQVKVVEIEKIPNLVIRDSQETLNRKWILPEKYKNAQTQVTIYSQTGEKVYDGTNYKDEFPKGEAQPENKGRSQLFFYVIKLSGGESKQGTITVLN